MAGHARPEDLLPLVKDKDSFMAFVRVMADEREEAAEWEHDHPESYQIDGAMGWKNADLPSFLYAALDYFEVKPFHRPEASPSLRMMADFLYCGKIIE
ncbi:MAG TPA: hypothetical protein VG125_08630 [Pirellulales bacterium]|jgi:hypothetical protein|nr:hypothetical protein [Pirellulales bacterium]